MNNTALRGKPRISRQDVVAFEVLYLIETEPGLTQRGIAEKTGYSVGRVNSWLRVLVTEGALENFQTRTSDQRLRQVYALTPKGVERRAVLTKQLLERKQVELERLRAQIEQLQYNAE